MEVLGDLLPVLMTVSSWPLESGEAGRWLVFVGVVPRAEIGGPGFQAGEFLPSASPEAEGSGWGGGHISLFPSAMFLCNEGIKAPGLFWTNSLPPLMAMQGLD